MRLFKQNHFRLLMRVYSRCYSRNVRTRAMMFAKEKSELNTHNLGAGPQPCRFGNAVAIAVTLSLILSVDSVSVSTSSLPGKLDVFLIGRQSHIHIVAHVHVPRQLAYQSYSVPVLCPAPGNLISVLSSCCS